MLLVLKGKLGPWRSWLPAGGVEAIDRVRKPRLLQRKDDVSALAVRMRLKVVDRTRSRLATQWRTDGHIIIVLVDVTFTQDCVQEGGAGLLQDGRMDPKRRTKTSGSRTIVAQMDESIAGMIPQFRILITLSH